jgi:hypothetical protein
MIFHMKKFSYEKQKQVITNMTFCVEDGGGQTQSMVTGATHGKGGAGLTVLLDCYVIRIILIK